MTFDSRNEALSQNSRRASFIDHSTAFGSFILSRLQRVACRYYRSGCFDSKLERYYCSRNWEMQGFGVPIYTNHGYEFKPRDPQPPTLPEMNPVGVYRRDIDIFPNGWIGIFFSMLVGQNRECMYISMGRRWVIAKIPKSCGVSYQRLCKTRENTLVLKYSAGQQAPISNVRIFGV